MHELYDVRIQKIRPLMAPEILAEDLPVGAKQNETIFGGRREIEEILARDPAAAGRLDAFWEIGLAQWDIAAGALLIKEAGGLVADIDASDNFMTSGNIVAGNPKCFKAVLQATKPLLG